MACHAHSANQVSDYPLAEYLLTSIGDITIRNAQVHGAGSDTRPSPLATDRLIVTSGLSTIPFNIATIRKRRHCGPKGYDAPCYYEITCTVADGSQRERRPATDWKTFVTTGLTKVHFRTAWAPITHQLVVVRIAR